MSLSMDNQREEIHDAQILSQDGPTKGALHTPAYSSPPPTPTWEECLQEIEDFDWKTLKGPVLDIPTSGQITLKATHEYTAEGHGLARAPGTESRLGNMDKITASSIQDDLASRELINVLTEKFESPLSSVQQTPLAAAATPGTTQAAPPSPPWIPSPTRSEFQVAAPIALRSVAVESTHNKDTENDHSDKENQQSSASDTEPLTTKPTTSTIPLDQTHLLELTKDVLANDAVDGDVTMGECQENLDRAMEDTALQEDQHHQRTLPVAQSPQIDDPLHKVASTPHQTDAALPSELPWQGNTSKVETSSSNLDAVYHPVNALKAVAENLRSIGSNELPPSSARCSEVDEPSRLTPNIAAHDIAGSNEIWQTQLHEAAKEYTDVDSETSTKGSTFEKAEADNIPKVFTLAIPKWRKKSISLTTQPDGEVGTASSSAQSYLKPDLDNARHHEYQLQTFPIDTVDPTANCEDQNLVKQQNETASLIGTAVEPFEAMSITSPSADHAATQKRKKLAKNVDRASDSEQEAPDKKKARKMMVEEAEVPCEDMVLDQQEPKHVQASNKQEKQQKAIKSPKEGHAITDTTLPPTIGASTTSPSFSVFAYGKHTSPLQNLSQSSTASTQHLIHPIPSSQPPNEQADPDTDSHLSDITDTASKRTLHPVIPPKPSNTLRVRPVVSLRELDGLSNNRPRVRPSVAKKRATLTPTPSKTAALDAELVALARPDTPTPLAKRTAKTAKQNKPAPSKNANAITTREPLPEDHTDDSPHEPSLPFPPSPPAKPVNSSSNSRGKSKPKSKPRPAPTPKTPRNILPKPDPTDQEGVKHHPFDVTYGKRHTRGDTKAALDSSCTSAGSGGGAESEGTMDEVGDMGVGVGNAGDAEFEFEEDGDDDDGGGHDNDEEEEEEMMNAQSRAAQHIESIYTQLSTSDLVVGSSTKSAPSSRAKTSVRIPTLTSTSTTSTTTAAVKPVHMETSGPRVVTNIYGFRTPPVNTRNQAGTGSSSSSSSSTAPTPTGTISTPNANASVTAKAKASAPTTAKSKTPRTAAKKPNLNTITTTATSTRAKRNTEKRKSEVENERLAAENHAAGAVGEGADTFHISGSGGVAGAGGGGGEGGGGAAPGVKKARTRAAVEKEKEGNVKNRLRGKGKG
ncbi:hypothetical protein NX059_011941 [Plenodomus lindquistii]|nr:hypothetical protein NX059_011941 [Plenodomus lindquistii]